MTDFERTAIVYAHFTLEEWKTLALLVAKSATPDSEKWNILTKMPSASLP